MKWNLNIVKSKTSFENANMQKDSNTMQSCLNLTFVWFGVFKYNLAWLSAQELARYFLLE